MNDDNEPILSLPKVSPRQHAAILAGLRLLERKIEDHTLAALQVDDVMTNEGRLSPLNADEISDLAESINLDTVDDDLSQ